MNCRAGRAVPNEDQANELRDEASANNGGGAVLPLKRPGQWAAGRGAAATGPASRPRGRGETPPAAPRRPQRPGLS